jgi:hypothetical protein
MIILVDNKDYMIKLCENSEDIHGFDTSFPCWQGHARLCSDIGMMAVVSGPEAEKFLDDNHIYYVHIEDEGESYKEFLTKLMDALIENKEFILTNNTFGKLVYGLDEDLEPATTETDNILEIWRYHEDGRYYLDLTLASELREMPSYVLKSVCDPLLDKVTHDLAPTMTVEELGEAVANTERPVACADDFDYLFSADSLKEMIVHLAILLKNIYTGEFIDGSDEEDESEEEAKDNSKEENPIKCTYYACVEYENGIIEKVPFSTRQAARDYIANKRNTSSTTQTWTE